MPPVTRSTRGTRSQTTDTRFCYSGSSASWCLVSSMRWLPAVPGAIVSAVAALVDGRGRRLPGAAVLGRDSPGIPRGS